MRPPGIRIVLDARPIQEPERAPITAIYLEQLLTAFDAEPLPGESFAFLLASDAPDPTERFANLEVVGRRLLPPTRLLRGGALTVDPVLVSGASLGAAWHAEQGGAAGAVYHAAGGALPLATRLPVIVTLLDLAPWELPDVYQRGFARRLGQRLRGRLTSDASAVIVGTEAIATAARRRLRVRRDRLRVVPLAPRPAFQPDAGTPAGQGRTTSPADRRRERERLGLPARYLVFSGRFDARQDLTTLLAAIAELATAGRPSELADAEPWPPRVLLLGASPADRAALARAAAREGVGECLAYAPALGDDRQAALVAGARAAIVPALSDATGLAAIEALGCATPVIATTVGALPEIVGAAGILVEAREPTRLAAAIRAIWTDEALYERLRLEARERAAWRRRTWSEVAAETRAIYAEIALSRAG